MKTRLAALALCMVLGASSMSPAQAEGNILTGTVRLACEAILCLSSGVQPGECGPSLDKYFGINLKTWDATQAARLAFLAMCPASSEPGMPGLINAIVDGAGQCDAKLLNRVLARKKIITVCDDNKNPWRSKDDGLECREVIVTIIDDTLPGYCRAYTTHEWSWKLGVRYVGDKNNGGKWVDER